MKITFRQQLTKPEPGKKPQVKKGHKDEWHATVDGLKHSGIGYTQGDAIWSLIRANTGAFGIEEIDMETVRIGESGDVIRERFIWIPTTEPKEEAVLRRPATAAFDTDPHGPAAEPGEWEVG